MAGATTTMAVRMDRYGPPEVLHFERVLLDALKPGEVRLRTLFAAVNHTDLKIRAGAWPIRKPTPFPYVPGVEVVGVVEEIGREVTQWSVGQIAVTMMQGLGGVRAERPGGYAEVVAVDADTLAPIPADVAPADIAALGLAGVTAFEGLRKLGSLRGKRVLVTGAAGGVGSAACALAVYGGADVVALISRPEQASYVEGLGAAEVILTDKATPTEIPAQSMDAVLDTVAGAVFEHAVNALRPGGVLSLVGAVGGGNVSIDAWALIRPVTLTGYSSEDLTGDSLRRAVGVLCEALRRGSIRAPMVETLPLASAAEAHERLERGGLRGRLLLSPARGAQ